MAVGGTQSIHMNWWLQKSRYHTKHQTTHTAIHRKLIALTGREGGMPGKSNATQSDDWLLWLCQLIHCVMTAGMFLFFLGYEDPNVVVPNHIHPPIHPSILLISCWPSSGPWGIWPTRIIFMGVLGINFFYHSIHREGEHNRVGVVSKGKDLILSAAGRSTSTGLFILFQWLGIR